MIDVSNLNYRYSGNREACLVNVDLNVPSGCCLGLLGPNGAGKTTLISLMTGAIRLQTGEITVNDLSIRQHRMSVRHLGSLVPQGLAFYPTLSGRANLEFFAGLHRLTASDAEKRISECIEVTRLGDVIDRRAGDYSGGMKRRLNLAIGILNKPRVLYLDEPTVGIDAASRQAILAAIQHLKSTGTTIVYTSHYLEEVEALCEEIAIIHRGRIIARNTTKELLERAAPNQLVVSFIDPPVEEISVALGGYATRWLSSSRLSINLPEFDAMTPVFELLQSPAFKVDHMHYGAGRLEEVYFDLLDRHS